MGITFSLVAGCGFPWFAYFWGKVFDSFLFQRDLQARLEDVAHYRNIIFYIGIGSLFASWIAFTSWIDLS
jgi:hypothetical protein